MKHTPNPKGLVHKSPSLGILAVIFTILFNVGLAFVCSTKEGAHFPGPWEAADVIVKYFQNYPHDVLMCAFFQFGASIPLLIYAAAVSSRLRFFGIQAAGTQIALVGGILASVNMGLSASVQWVMAYPGIAQNADVIRTLYYFVYATGGAAYSVPLGLLIAGISVTAFFARLLPKWLVVSGMVLAVVGQLSWLSMIFPKALFLIPLTRFPGFLWLIAVGFLLPKSRPLTATE